MRFAGVMVATALLVCLRVRVMYETGSVKDLR